MTVTLVLTDVAGSTQLWADHPDVMGAVMARHHEIVHDGVAAQGGWRPVDQGEGDAVFAAFDSATAAVAAALRFQQQLAAEPWPPGIDIKVRVGVHTGEVTARDGNLFGSTVNRCARLRGLGSGGQVLLSASTWEVVRDRLPDGVTVTDLGEHRMKDLTRPEHVHQLGMPGLPTEFPPLASLDRARHNLPIQTSSFLGRDREVAELVRLIGRERLVTITGFGGMGKTRLALQVAAELATGDGDGVWFIDLSAVTDTAAVPSLIATTLGITEGAGGPLSALLTALKGRYLLLVLDNLEQLLPDAATLVGRLLGAGPLIRIMTTCREPLRVRGEHEYPVRPLAVPPPPRPPLSDAEVGRLSTYAAVSLFLTRAVAVRPDFTLTPTNAAAVAAICARLDGLPLALELAAARTRMLSPEALLPRLDNALKMLTGGSRDLPARHQTLRATIAWSYDTLGENDKALLDRLSVFPGTFTLEAAEAVCGPQLTDGADVLDVLDGIGLLVDRSLVRHHPATTTQPEDRYSLLVSIRTFASERLADSGHTAKLLDCHVQYYTALTTLPADWTLDDMILRDGCVLAEVHNVRAALAHVHSHGRPEAEVALAARSVRAILISGSFTDCTAIVSDALSRPAATTPDLLRLLSQAATIELIDGSTDRALARAEELCRAARQFGEPSLLADALTTEISVARTAARVRQLTAELRRVMDHLPSSGTYVPLWVLRHNMDAAMTDLLFVEPQLALEAGRSLVRRAVGADKLLDQAYMCGTLLHLGLNSEAEPFARVFEAMPASAGSVTIVRGHFNAARLRLLEGDLDAALVDIGRAKSGLETLDLPTMRVQIACLQAAAARLRHDRDGARTILTNLLSDVPRNADPVEIARSRWLLSVMRWENGDHEQASALLARAWADVAGRDIHHLDLVLECLLERAVHVAAGDPRRAVALISAVKANRGPFALVDGVRYDTDAMLEGLRNRLGDAEVDRILASTGGQPLPNSAGWSYVDDSEGTA